MLSHQKKSNHIKYILNTIKYNTYKNYTYNTMLQCIPITTYKLKHLPKEGCSSESKWRRNNNRIRGTTAFISSARNPGRSPRDRTTYMLIACRSLRQSDTDSTWKQSNVGLLREPNGLKDKAGELMNDQNKVTVTLNLGRRQKKKKWCGTTNIYSINIHK